MPVLQEISRHLQQTLDIDVLIPSILHEVNKAIDAEAQSLWLVDHEAGLMVCHYATGPQADAIKKVTVPVGLGIVGSSVEKRLPIMVLDAQAEGLVFRGADQQTGFVTRCLLCVPLVRQGKAIGAIEAVNKRDGPFTQSDLELLTNIADSAALCIENARLYFDLSASYDSTLEALMGALDSRDRETEGHSRRVSDYTVRLAQQIGLDGSAIATIRRGALIHDIGKMSIPDAILNKPGPLDAEERRIMQRHPMSGYEMLFGIPQLKNELSIVLAHHERWDGGGYPFGLAGEAIPLAARLFSVSDTFDAVTSERSYRPARSCEEALRVIASERGRQFDPVAVDAFQAIPPGEWEAIRDGVLARLTRRRASREEQLRRRHSEMLASRPKGAPPK
ncbi:MAG TPA: HD domain-containing phosphohydrolase [Vicinamibacteria bacterium]